MDHPLLRRLRRAAAVFGNELFGSGDPLAAVDNGRQFAARASSVRADLNTLVPKPVAGSGIFADPRTAARRLRRCRWKLKDRTPVEALQ